LGRRSDVGLCPAGGQGAGTKRGQAPIIGTNRGQAPIIVIGASPLFAREFGTASEAMAAIEPGASRGRCKGRVPPTNRPLGHNHEAPGSEQPE
jgi:hypothetical protein